MALRKIALIACILLHLVTSSPILSTPENSILTYDVVIVGGGPAGLSAASALGRVRRTALLIDSAEYRKADINIPTQQLIEIPDENFAGNAATAEMHDVIENDGSVPSEFRALARAQISVYSSISMMNGTVTSITP